MTRSRRLLIFLAAATVLRVAFALVFGPSFESDALTYDRAAMAFATRGPLAGNVYSIPYHPAGYPLFLASFYAVIGHKPLVITVVQGVLIGVATYLIYRLVSREMNDSIAWGTAIVVSLSPSVLMMSATLQYESLILFLLVVAVDLSSRASRDPDRALLFATGAGVALAIAVPIQPKVALTGLFLAMWLAFKCPRKVAAGAMTLLIVAGIALGGLRTQMAEGHFTLAENLGVMMAMGFHYGATGTNSGAVPFGCAAVDEGDSSYERDSSYTRCTTRWVVSNPIQAAQKVVMKTLYFWSPSIGPEGEWMSPIDPRPLMRPWMDPARFSILDTLVRAALTLVSIVVLGVGIWMATRRFPASNIVLLLIPTISFLMVAWATIGDPRYRLPVLPFYVPIGLLPWYWAFDQMRKRRAMR